MIINKKIDASQTENVPIIVGVVAFYTLPHQRTIMSAHTKDEINLLTSIAGVDIYHSSFYIISHPKREVQWNVYVCVPVQQSIQNSYTCSRSKKKLMSPILGMGIQWEFFKIVYN